LSAFRPRRLNIRIGFGRRLAGGVILVQNLLRLRSDFVASFLTDQSVRNGKAYDYGDSGGYEASFQILRHALTTLVGPARVDLKPSEFALSPLA